MSSSIIVREPSDLLRNSRASINQNFETLYAFVAAGIGTTGGVGGGGDGGVVFTAAVPVVTAIQE